MLVPRGFTVVGGRLGEDRFGFRGFPSFDDGFERDKFPKKDENAMDLMVVVTMMISGCWWRLKGEGGGFSKKINEKKGDDVGLIHRGCRRRDVVQCFLFLGFSVITQYHRNQFRTQKCKKRKDIYRDPD